MNVIWWCKYHGSFFHRIFSLCEIPSPMTHHQAEKLRFIMGCFAGQPIDNGKITIRYRISSPVLQSFKKKGGVGFRYGRSERTPNKPKSHFSTLFSSFLPSLSLALFPFPVFFAFSFMFYFSIFSDSKNLNTPIVFIVEKPEWRCQYPPEKSQKEMKVKKRQAENKMKPKRTENDAHLITVRPKPKPLLGQISI